jgi:HSP90 family molecular chaperone
VQEAEKVKAVMKSETYTEPEWEQQNKNKPIWTRPAKDVTDDEYNNFFTTAFKEFVPPMARNHFNVEGTYEFSGLLFVPGMAPFDQFQHQESKKSSIRLFVKRVFISDQFDEQLLPKYLGFIKGIVDSSDLPLNVSREILQVCSPLWSCTGVAMCTGCHVCWSRRRQGAIAELKACPSPNESSTFMSTYSAGSHVSTMRIPA